MMNPGFVRWVTGTANVKTTADLTSQLNTLADMTRVQPELRSAHQALKAAHAGDDQGSAGRGEAKP